MTAVLDPQTVDRLNKLMGLLGSDHVGERASAAAAADRLLRKHGLTWREFIERHHGGDLRHHGADQTETRSLKDTIEFCLAHREAINDWEFNFLSDIRTKFVLGLSQRQLAKLGDISAKVKTYLAATSV